MIDMKDIPMNSNQNAPLVAMNEVAFALCIGQMTPEGVRQFKDDPHEFLLLHADTNIDEGIKLEVVDNDDKTMHLALPYYSTLETVPQKMSDEEAEVAGGFEIICIAAFGVGGTVLGIGFATGAGFTIGLGTALTVASVAGAAVAASAALIGVGVVGSQVHNASVEEYLSRVTTTSVGNGQVWKRA